MSPSVVVIGAGISGLAAAHRVLELAPETQLQVLEAGSRTGGLIRTERIQDFLVEQGPDAIITDKPAALALAKRLGLETQIIRTNDQDRGAFVVSQGSLERIPEGFSMMAPTKAMPILRSPILSTKGKLRMLAEVLLPRGAEQAEDESTQSFVERRFGTEVLERLAQPLMGGIYGTSLNELSLKATMPRFAEMESDSRSVTLGLLRKQKLKSDNDAGVRYGLFFSFKHGVETLTQELTRRLESKIRLGATAETLTRTENGFAVRLADGETVQAERVILALSATQISRLLGSIAPNIQAELAAIPYGSTATVAYGWKREAIPHALNGFGFVVPKVEQRPLIASTWASKKFPGRSPEGHELIRVFFGGAGQEEILERSNDELIQLGRQELRELLGVTAEPSFATVWRQTLAMPKYVVGHLARVGRITSMMQSHPDIALAGNSLHGVGIPDAIAAGERAAERIVRPSASESSPKLAN